MLATIYSCATIGLNSVLVEVEVDVKKQGWPGFKIVGLPNKAIEEAKERVRSAIKNSGATFPNHHITINLAPAELPKEGSIYDLPIALGILLASGEVSADLEQTMVVGELSLDGSLRPVHGVLPAALLTKEEGWKTLLAPKENAPEASVVKGIDIIPIDNLKNLIYHLHNIKPIETHPPTNINKLTKTEIKCEYDLAEIKGQLKAKRGLEIAAAGGHNIIMKGPPGAGKTLLARTMPSILPTMTAEEALETTKIYSISGNLPPGTKLIATRPFRSPHHTVSRVGLIGGGTKIQPGEVSLAHSGVLFMDEFPEFPRSVLESLRQPVEDGVVTISRASGTLTFPAQFILIAAQNPCPCGFFESEQKACRCTASEIRRYQRKVSGPILDRIDIHLRVPAVKIKKLISKDKGNRKTSAEVRAGVESARKIQRKRFKGSKIKCNAQMGNREIKQHANMNQEAEDILNQAAAQFHLSARAYHKLIKLARTIADLAKSEEINKRHINEAIQFRWNVRDSHL